MRLRSSFAIALLVVAAGACAAAPDGGGQAATVAPAATTPTRASIAMNRPTGYAPPGLLPASRRKPAPPLRVTDVDGRMVSLAGLGGRPVVVSFFESWCGTCQAEQPDLSKVAGDFAGRVGFVGVSYRDTVAAGRAYQRRFKVPYPLANDASGRTWARWRVPYQPVVVLVDKHGRVAERFDGGTTGGTLAAALGYLLGE
jgi:thiol-disulfide isomerase/thioredoxin